MHPTSTICFGSSTGFLLSGLLAVLSGSCALAALPFLCSVLSTAYGCGCPGRNESGELKPSESATAFCSKRSTLCSNGPRFRVPEAALIPARFRARIGTAAAELAEIAAELVDGGREIKPCRATDHEPRNLSTSPNVDNSRETPPITRFGNDPPQESLNEHPRPSELEHQAKRAEHEQNRQADERAGRVGTDIHHAPPSVRTVHASASRSETGNRK